MVSAILLAAVLAAVANAAPSEPNKLSTSVFTTVTHVTKYRLRSGGRAPGHLSTKTRVAAEEITSTITTCGSSSTLTTTFIPDPVTSTVYGFGNNTDAHSSLTPRAGEMCTITTTVPASVATVFTGNYNATVAKRTAGLFDSKRSPALRPNLFRQIVHRLGQNALVDQNAFEVDCFHKQTTYIFTTKTDESLPATETVTAETPTVYVTQQKNKALLEATGDTAAAGGVCTVTASASSTTTQHLKCAPTNLIGEVDGYGIGQTQGDESNTRGLAPGSDPSACCQLCVDTEGCAASEDDQAAGNCFLWFTEPTCGLGFKYSTNNQKLEPGEGFLVQTGCGSIQATDPPMFD